MSHVDAWKALIDLSKTTISLSSAVLTTLIGYLVLKQSLFGGPLVNYIPLTLLILSIVLALYGFGGAISAIKTGVSEKRIVFFVNFSIFFLVVGILSITLMSFEQSGSLDAVASKIAQETKSLQKQLMPNEITKMEVSGALYIITYESGEMSSVVTFSSKEDRIIKFE